MAPGCRSTANTDHLQAWKTKFANMDIICKIIGRCKACKKVFIPGTSFWSPQISGHGNNSNALQFQLTDWWACLDMEVDPEPTKWMFIFWSTIEGTNPEIVHKEVHKTPKRKGSKSSRKKPHHHSHTSHKSSLLLNWTKKGDGRDGWVGRKINHTPQIKKITRHVINKSKRWSKISCTHTHAHTHLPVAKSKKHARIETWKNP